MLIAEAVVVEILDRLAREDPLRRLPPRKRAVKGDTKVFVPSPHKEPPSTATPREPDTWPHLENDRSSFTEEETKIWGDEVTWPMAHD